MVAEEVAIDQRQRAAEQWFHCLHRTFDLLWPGEVGNQPNQPNPVKIAILNSGVDMSAFAYATEQIKDCKSFLKSITKFGDYVGSGTHETDLILSVAPEAEVFVARISESMKLKRETENNVKNALDHAIDEWKVDIIVLPFGFSTFSPIIEESLLRADERRILLFAAVGNHGAMEQYPYPAKSPLTIPIHSADAYGKPSVFDPPARNVNDPSFSTLGEGVKAAWPPALCGHDEQINFRVRSGSDVATVIAAATAGLVLEFARQPPLSNKPQVEAWLKSKKGMLRIFKLMSKPVNGMNFVVPWLLLDAAATPPYSDDFNSAEGGFSSQSLARWAAEFAILREVPMDLTAESTTQVFDVDLDTSHSRGTATTHEWMKLFRSHTNEIFAERPELIPTVRIAVLDTGIDAGHPYIKKHWRRPGVNKEKLQDRGYRDFVSTSATENTPIIDKSGHGTHVAGIILQFAPDAELYVARVFEHDLTSKLEEEEVINRIVKAIDYATNVWKVNIISMSFGFRQNIDSIYEALRRANLQKVVIFAAASNDGNRLRVAFPARCRDLVICMNSTDGSGGKSVYNPLPMEGHDNFSILGENVKSVWSRYGRLDNTIEQRDGLWKYASGTSVAAPMGAALAALILEYKNRYRHKIPSYRRLEGNDGIRKIFKEMARQSDGFKDIVPWAKVFNRHAKHIIFSFFEWPLLDLEA